MVKKILVVVDAQQEFITGALGSKECVAAVPNIVKEINSGDYEKVIVTQDTHGADYLDTQEGKRLPVIHGQEGTEGYQIHPDIVAALKTNFKDEDVYIIKKPTFGSLDFGKLLKELYDKMSGKDTEVEVCFTGFCTGICVISNVVIAKTFCSEARLYVIAKACACVTPETHQTALNAMTTFQVGILN